MRGGAPCPDALGAAPGRGLRITRKMEKKNPQTPQKPQKTLTAPQHTAFIEAICALGRWLIGHGLSRGAQLAAKLDHDNLNPRTKLTAIIRRGKAARFFAPDTLTPVLYTKYGKI